MEGRLLLENLHNESPLSISPSLHSGGLPSSFPARIVICNAPSGVFIFFFNYIFLCIIFFFKLLLLFLLEKSLTEKSGGFNLENMYRNFL